MKVRKVAVFFSMTVGFISQAQAGIYEKLSPQEQAQLNRGEQVLKSEDVGGPLPKFTVYQKIEATAFESAAVFTDFDRHKEFFPQITASHVVESLPGGVMTAQYDLTMVGQTDHTRVKEVVSKVGDSYQVEWKLLSSGYAERSDGSAVFEPMGNKGEATLLVYTSQLVPKSSLPFFIFGLFKGMVGSELQGTVNHLVNRVKTLKAEFSANTNPGNPTLLTVEKYKLGKILQ